MNDSSNNVRFHPLNQPNCDNLLFLPQTDELHGRGRHYRCGFILRWWRHHRGKIRLVDVRGAPYLLALAVDRGDSEGEGKILF